MAVRVGAMILAEETPNTMLVIDPGLAIDNTLERSFNIVNLCALTRKPPRSSQ